MIDYRRRELTPTVEAFANNKTGTTRIHPPGHDERLALHAVRIRAALDRLARKANRRAAMAADGR